jgi:hypothetical protein
MRETPMASKWDVDFDDYEEREGGFYAGEEPKKGLYEGKLVVLEEHTTSDDALHFVFEITEEPYAGWRGHLYSNMSSAKWKTQQIAKAIQGGEERKIVLDPDKSDRVIAKAKPVMLLIRQEKYQDEMRGRIARVMATEATSVKGKKKSEPWDDSDDDDNDDDD